MTPPSVLIVGGGIGGLTTAIALHRVGIPARVVEQAPTLGTVGAGITIQCNASAVFDALGVRFAPEDVVSIGRFEMRARGGAVVMSGDSDDLDLPFASVNIHRADLQATLVRHLEALGGRLELGRRVVAVRSTDSHADVVFGDGETARVDLVLGVDGLNSTVRKMLLGSTGSRYSGQTCWRFAVPIDAEVPILSLERWDGGRRAGLVPLSRGRVYGYLVQSAPPGTPGPDTQTAAHVLERFGGMHAGLDAALAELVQREAAGEPVPIHHGDLRDQPHISFGRGRVVLLGDAGHATTPNMGQGAGMAIEDAAAVAIALGSGAVAPERLADHLDGTRRDRVVHVQKTSWRIGAMAHWQHPVVTWLRDTMLGMLPESVATRQAIELYQAGIELADDLRGVVAARGEVPEDAPPSLEGPRP